MKRTLFLVLSCLIALAICGASLAATKYETAVEHYDRGEYSKAISILTEYVKEKPEPSAYYLIGYSYYKLGKFKEANKYFDYAFLVDPQYSPTPGLLESGRITPEQVEKGIGLSEERPAARAAVKQSRPAPAAVREPGLEEPALKVPALKEPESPPVVVVEQFPDSPPRAVPVPQAPSAPQAPPVPQAQSAPPVPLAPEQEVLGRVDIIEEPAVAPPPPAAQEAPRAVSPPPKPRLTTPKPSASPMEQRSLAMLLAAGMTVLLIAAGILLLLYLFSCYLIFRIAKKLDISHAWLSFIPIAQVFVMIACAGKPWWWIFLFLVPLVNLLVLVYIWMLISENLGKSKWLGLLVLPFAIMSIVAFLNRFVTLPIPALSLGMLVLVSDVVYFFLVIYLAFSKSQVLGQAPAAMGATFAPGPGEPASEFGTSEFDDLSLGTEGGGKFDTSDIDVSGVDTSDFDVGDYDPFLGEDKEAEEEG